MKILVLLKLVVDPDIPPAKFKIDYDLKTQVVDDNPILISSYDENALEVALKLKEKHNFEVDVLTLTNLDYSQPIRKALAMGADKAFVLLNPQKFMDVTNTAKIIADYITGKKYNLILTGFESADWGQRTFAPVLASILNLNLITFSYKIEYQDNFWKVYKLVDNGYIVLKTNQDIVVSITTHSENQPRYPKVKEIMLASKKPIFIEEIKGQYSNSVKIEKLEQPTTKIECQIIEGKDSHEKAQKLYQKLKELKII